MTDHDTKNQAFARWWASYEEEDEKTNNLPSRYHAAHAAWEAALRSEKETNK